MITRLQTPRLFTRARFALPLLVCALPSFSPGQTPAGKSETVQLSEFVVSTSADRGYRASNAVSATRLNIAIKDIPISLTAFTEEFIRDVSPDMMNEIVTYAPGVTKTNASFGGTRDQMNIRGFETQPLRNGFAGAGLVDPATIARVEVSRGPSSVLYGSLAPGGVINYLVKRPKAERGGDLSLSVGSYDRLGAQLDIWGSIDPSEKIRYRFVAVGDTRKDIYPNYRSEHTLVFPVIQWLPFPDWSITADFERSKTAENSTPLLKPQIRPSNFSPAQRVGWSFYPLPKDFSYSNKNDLREQDNTVSSIEVLGKVIGWDVRGYYNFNQRHVYFLSTGTSDVTNNLPADASFNYLGRRGRLEGNNATGEALQLETSRKFTFGSNFVQVLVGGQDLRGFGNGFQYNRAGGLNPPKWDLRDPSTWDRDAYIRLSDLVLSSYNYSNSKTRSYYATAIGNFFQNRLTLLGGYRLNELENFTRNRITNVTTVNPSVKKNSPQFGGMLKITKTIGLYASYSTSFSGQPGTKFVRGVPSGPIEPVEGEGYDAGLKFDFIDGRLSFNAGVFKATNDNFATNIFEIVPGTSTTLQSTITGRTMESTGAEFEGTYVANQNLQIYASYGYMDASIKKSVVANFPVGTPLSFAPKHSFSFLGKYTFTQGMLKNAHVGSGVQAISEQFYSEELGSSVVPFKLDGYALVDFFCGYSWKHRGHLQSSLQLQVKNLFDSDYDPSFFNRYQPRRFLLTYRISL